MYFRVSGTNNDPVEAGKQTVDADTQITDLRDTQQSTAQLDSTIGN